MRYYNHKQIKAAAKQKGISLQYLAVISGITYGRMRQWSIGNSAPNAKEIAVLANTCDVDVSFFYSDSEVE